MSCCYLRKITGRELVVVTGESVNTATVGVDNSYKPVGGGFKKGSSTFVKNDPLVGGGGNYYNLPTNGGLLGGSGGSWALATAALPKPGGGKSPNTNNGGNYINLADFKQDLADNNLSGIEIEGMIIIDVGGESDNTSVVAGL